MRVALLVVFWLAVAPAAPAAVAERPWPPRDGAGHLFVHYGEEHWNDIDGTAVLTKVVEDTIRYRPDLVTMSGDKDNDGTVEQLEEWRRIMDAYDRAGIPYMAAVGNHDGKQPTPEPVTDHAAGSTPIRDITFYKQVFAVRPYPMGDAPPYPNPLMAPKARPADDPAGASSHYYVDYGSARFVFIDSSCYGIVNCEPYQSPPDGQGRDQYQFLRDAAGEANAAGRALFIVTHMPTRDPRDQGHSTTAQRNHVMGKGISPDNQRLEAEAEQLGAEAVLVAHIKGQWQYKGRGDVPYFIDGGAGGELYTSGPRGVDHGYWYGWRLLRADGGRLVETDVVPVIVPGGISIEGPARLTVGEDPLTWQAFARQPATKSERGVVERLELRDPDPVPRSGEEEEALGPVLVWTAPLLALLALGLLSRAPAPRRPRVLAPATLVLVVAPLGIAAIAGAQRSEPTSTPKEALPNPARIWTSADPLVLAPVASATDDPRRDVRTQTADGSFRPECPGRTTLSVTTGFETASVPVRVASEAGDIVDSLRRGARSARRGRTTTLARLRLAQPAIVEASVLRGRRTVRDLGRACRPAGARRLAWDGRVRRRGRLSRAPRGRYRVVVRVHSDRKAIVRRWSLRVR